jgi:arsenate reductase-like glutaredoxin family protein
LKGAGYSVTRIRMSALTRELFHHWLEEVGDNWETMVADR